MCDSDFVVFHFVTVKSSLRNTECVASVMIECEKLNNFVSSARSKTSFDIQYIVFA